MCQDRSVFTLSYSRNFSKALRKLDPPVQQSILAALMALTLLEDPTVKLKPLRRSKVGLWRLRVGNYRAIVDVQPKELVIVALDAGHHSTIYAD